MISRQKVTGWVLVAVSAAFLLYFFKLRLFTPPPLETREWLQFVGMVVILMIGVANIRLAAMRERKKNAAKQ